MQKVPAQVTVAHSGYDEADDLTALDKVSNLDNINTVNLVGEEATSNLEFGSTMLANLEKKLPEDDAVFYSGETSFTHTPETHEPEISKEAYSIRKQFFEWCCQGYLDNVERIGCENLAMEEFNKQDYDPVTLAAPQSSHTSQENIQQLALSPDEEFQAHPSCDEKLVAVSPFSIQGEVSSEEGPKFQDQFEQYTLHHYSPDRSLDNTPVCSAENNPTMASSSADVAEMALSTAGVATIAVPREVVSKAILPFHPSTPANLLTNSEEHISQHSGCINNSVQQAVEEARIGDTTIQSSNSSNRAHHVSKTFSLPVQNSLSKEHRKYSSVKRQIRRAVRKAMSTEGEQRVSSGTGKRGPKQLSKRIHLVTSNVQHSTKALLSAEDVSARHRESNIQPSDTPENCTFDHLPVSAKPPCTPSSPHAINLIISNGRVGKTKSAKNGRKKSPARAFVTPEAHKQGRPNCNKGSAERSQSKKEHPTFNFEESIKTLHTKKEKCEKRFKELEGMVWQVKQEACAFAGDGAGEGTTKVLDAVNESLATIQACKESCLQAFGDDTGS